MPPLARTLSRIVVQLRRRACGAKICNGLYCANPRAQTHDQYLIPASQIRIAGEPRYRGVATEYDWQAGTIAVTGRKKL